MKVMVLFAVLIIFVCCAEMLGGEPSGGIIADLMFFDDNYNSSLITFSSYTISNLGPVSVPVHNGIQSLRADYGMYGGLLLDMTHPDTSVFWIQPNSRLQFWTHATSPNEALRVLIRPQTLSPLLLRDYFYPAPNANEWYFVDIQIDSAFRNVAMKGFEIDGGGLPHTKYFDDIKVTNVRLYAGPGEPDPAPMTYIAASQIGYAPAMRKLFSSPADFSSFQIVRVSDNAVMHTGGPSSRAVASEYINGTYVWIGDFSGFTTPGRYKILAGGKESYPFNIGTDTFDQPLRAAQRMLYYQRAFTDVVMPYAEGPWVHGSTAPVAPAGIVAGWHEAGNYPVQISAVAQAIQSLLSAWEDFRPMNDTTNIPESNNGVPDLLDEIKWGLRFVLSMEDASGGFWTTACPNGGADYYPYGSTPPEALTQFIKVSVGTPSAAKAVAVLAYASVVYREFDVSFANECLAAAQRGWTWLSNHPEITPDNISCIAYNTNGDATSMASQRMWAAAALLYATGDAQYHTAFETYYVNIDWIPSYSLTHAYAGRLYLRSPAGTASRKALVLVQMSNQATIALNAGYHHPFGVAIQYYWGSLSNALQSSGSYGWKFYLEDHSRTDDRDQSLENIHYILGRNLMNECYVSGLTGASNGRDEGFHHWLKAMQATPFNYPGILSGGPNSDPPPHDQSWPPGAYGYYGDPRYPRGQATPIDGRYTDNDSWSTNELVVAWNAIFVYNLYAAQAVAKNQLPPAPAPLSRASVKVLLGGAYNPDTGLMTNSLKTSGVLANHFTGAAIPAHAVDSISIEIRNAPTAAGSSIRLYQPAWLLTDGTIRSFADTTKLYVEFPSPPGNYYLVVRHRNHLAIMSSPSVSLSPALPVVYDFTTSQSAAFGTNPMQQVGAKFVVYAGDGNESGLISAADANAVFGQLNGAGYNITDVNVSGIVSAADANIVFGNLNKSTQVP